jgi:hypothetical protein
MKDFISTTYTFTPGISGVGTVNLSGIDNFDPKLLVAIINQTKGVVIYATGSTSTGYTNITDSTLTLTVNTSTHSSSDILQVIYNDTETAIKITNEQIEDLLEYMSTLMPIIGKSLGTLDSLDRIRVRGEVIDLVTLISTITTVSTVTAVTNVTNMAGMTQGEFGNMLNHQAWNNYISDNITF